MSVFLWGAATSAYQVEGGIINNDWDYFTRSKEIKNRISILTKPSIFYKGTKQVIIQSAGEAAKARDPSYYLHDFELARKLGMNSFRISIEWSRIQPQQDKWEEGVVDEYIRMIRGMKDRGLNPIVTLNHLTLPLWILTPPANFRKKLGQSLLISPLKDIPLVDPPSEDLYWRSLRGWENHQTVREFVKFVSKVVMELRNLVDYWITICEPVASIIGIGYIAGLWPPGFFLDGNRAKKVLHNLIEAHVQAYDKITELDNVDADGDGISKRVGFAHSMLAVSPARPTKIIGATLKNTEAAKNFSYFVNDYFINAVVNGEEDLNYLDTLERYNKDSNNFILHNNWKKKADFIGIDYYRRVYVYHSNVIALSSARFVGGALVNNLELKNKQQHGILNDLGWEIYPQGLYELIMHLKNQWGDIAVFITENGVADKSDRYRGPFIVAHVEQIKRAIDNGADVIGYLHWSFMDNYEWLDGYKSEAKFGLFRIDYNKSDEVQVALERQLTRGAEALKLIIEKSTFEGRGGTISNTAILKAEAKFGKFNADGSKLVLPKREEQPDLSLFE
jgi:beta-glucosidase